MADYSPEQIADVKEREAKALAYLKELQLTPAAQIFKVRLEGKEDIFADRLIPYLQDLKFQSVKSDNKEVNPTL